MNNHKLLLAAALAFFLTACGDKKPADVPTPAPAPVVAPAPAATPVAENAVGKKVYGNVCALCHAGNVGGAPKPGNKEQWGPRIAQGKDILYKHAIEGYNGKLGAMPARGGITTLTDDEVKAGVDYMVGLSN